MTSDNGTQKTLIIAGALALLAGAIVAYAVFLTPSPKAADTDNDLAGRVKSAVHSHVLPRMELLATSTETLAANIGAYCDSADGNKAAWNKLKSSFRSAVGNWAKADHLRFGPLASKARAQRISFWPDPRGIVWRQLRTRLAKQDVALTAPGALAEQSVALQGLTALEYIIAKPIPVGNEATKADQYKCDLAHAIAKNVAATSQGALEGWTRKAGWRDLLLNPGPDNKVYKTHKEAAAELVKSAMLGFQLIRDQQIKLLQEIVEGKNKLSRLPFHRSGLSEMYLKGSIASSCEFVEQLNLIPYVPDDKKWVRTWIPNSCRVLNDTASKLYIPPSPRKSFRDDAKVELRQLRFYSNGLRQIIGRDIAPAAGLTIGFNELDGD